MDAASLREKAALCLRIAKGLSWNNPSRLELTDLAERLDRQARDSELENRPAGADSSSHRCEGLISFLCANQRTKFAYRRGPARDRHSEQSLLLNLRTVL